MALFRLYVGCHMSRIFLCFSALAMAAALAGCAHGPTPPPEPDMSRLVIVNKTIPAELVGSVPVIAPKEDDKK